MKKSETLVSFDLLRENIVFILLSTAVTVVLYYIKYFEGPYSLHYSIFFGVCLLYTSPSPRDPKTSRMPSSA